jgi:GR25 family glycosyltransferase involved in LPS biosynthesis
MVTLNGKKLADRGVYINLDRREDRKIQLLHNLEEFNIEGVERFSAISSSSCSHCNLLESTFKIYEDFVDSDDETLLILEDDCKFLEPLNSNSEKILSDIYSTEWDLFWLGCVNRKKPVYYKNNCYQVSSTSYAQSYLIKKNMVKQFLNDIPRNFYLHLIDELLCLYTYNMDVVMHPFEKELNFYGQENPLEVFSTNFISLCYEYPLSTQYNSYSDLWNHETTLENWIPLYHPKTKVW